jgi:hypothetical protein
MMKQRKIIILFTRLFNYLERLEIILKMKSLIVLNMQGRSLKDIPKRDHTVIPTPNSRRCAVADSIYLLTPRNARPIAPPTEPRIKPKRIPRIYKCIMAPAKV